MSEQELQEEEREVLSSIYEGDDCFKTISPNTFQYKYGEHDTNKSFLIEIIWNEHYPNVLPTINMDTFYNKHVGKDLKEKIITLLTTEAEQYLGMSMTYSLFEYLKEKFDDLIIEQPYDETMMESLIITEDTQILDTKPMKKEHLTKAQKRRQWDRVDSKGEKARGWNWIDIVKHLSQTGGKEDQTS